MNALALNNGSSSVKFGFYELFTESKFDASSVIELFSQALPSASAQEVFTHIEKQLEHLHLGAPTVIGHRLVHGGPALRHHCLIDDGVMQALEQATAYAPLHLPDSIKLIREARAQFPLATQVACFDTSFHANLPDEARVLPIAHDLQLSGVQRYGFHGLSCESIVRQLRTRQIATFPPRLIIAHLGNGVSVTAVKDGQSIDTSMGLTPSGGVIMGTRSGDIDPGLLIYLMREKKMDLAAIDQMINHQSGLMGISGLSNDMRRLHEAAALKVHPSSDAARLAINMFCYCLRKQIAAMIAVLEGVDLIVFTGGIGENDAQVRAMICDGLEWAHDASSPFDVLVLPSQEEEQIATVILNLRQ
jgi:acetate kinase